MKRIKFTLIPKIFLLLISFVILPMNLIIFSMKTKFENYITSELQTRITQTLVKSEDELYDTFDKLASLSNVIVSNEVLKNELSSNASYYEKVKTFDKVLREIMVLNVLDISDIQVTILDNDNKIYSNWATNYNDYSFLSNEEIVKESKINKGHVKWSVFEDSFIVEDKGIEKYVGLARSIQSAKTYNEEIGTLIISIRQKEISKILDKYLYNENDCVYLCDNEGQVILKEDRNNKILSENESVMPSSYLSEAENQVVKNINSNKYLLCKYDINKRWTIDNRALSVCYFTDYQFITQQFRDFTKQINIMVFMALIIVIVVVYILVNTIARPIKLLEKQMNKYDMNSENIYGELDIKRRDEIGHLNRAFYNMNKNIQELFKRVKQEQKIKEQYHINYLKAQLNPHFLFNTLGTIKWMAVIKNADDIVTTIDALGDMLRYSMGKGEDLVYIKEEIENIKGYVKIQNTRYGGICDVKVEMADELLNYKIIRFILQPVIENSIIHGFKKGNKNNLILIEIKLRESYLEVIIQDNGRGVSKEQLDAINKDITNSYLLDKSLEYKKFNKIGIKNVNDQIKIQFGNEYGLYFDTTEEGGTKVIYHLPIIEGDNYEESNDYR